MSSQTSESQPTATYSTSGLHHSLQEVLDSAALPGSQRADFAHDYVNRLQSLAMRGTTQASLAASTSQAWVEAYRGASLDKNDKGKYLKAFMPKQTKSWAGMSSSGQKFKPDETLSAWVQDPTLAMAELGKNYKSFWDASDETRFMITRAIIDLSLELRQTYNTQVSAQTCPHSHNSASSFSQNHESLPNPHNANLAPAIYSSPYQADGYHYHTPSSGYAGPQSQGGHVYPPHAEVASYYEGDYSSANLTITQSTSQQAVTSTRAAPRYKKRSNIYNLLN
nr:uncharacterized protein CI109_006577 [Kwoniella shandongensis]KAA5525115.1 hypothetical protein CI109_006577 [Kwoniella shandongensis]